MKTITTFASAIALALTLLAFAGPAKAAVLAVATPTPIPTVTPLAGLPYPAYGTPAPGIATGTPVAGVPQTITLAQAISIAAAKSPLLAGARGSEALAGANVGLARAPELPSVSAIGSTQRFNGSAGSTGGAGGAGAGASSGGRGFTSNSLTSNLRQLVFDGGKVASQIRAATENQAGSVATFRRQLQTVSFNVANAYYNALAAERATALAAQVVHQNEVQENLVLAQIRAGVAPRSDLATAQLPTAQARVALVRAQGAELAALATFANTLGLDANTDVRPLDDTPANPTATLLQAPLLSYDAAMQRATLLRPDLEASQRSVNAARASLKAASLGRIPNLSGTGSLGTASTDAGGGTFRTSNSVGAQLSIPIFDQGLTRAQTQSAQAQLDIANANFDTTRLGVGLSVRQALVNLISAQAALQQAEAELNKAQEVLRATQAQYKAGVTTLPLLLNAQVGLTQAQTDQLNAIYALRQAEQSYLFALGENDTQLGLSP